LGEKEKMKTTREAKEHTEQVLHMSYRKEFRFNFSAPLVDLCSKKDATMKDINDVLVKQMDYIEHLLESVQVVSKSKLEVKKKVSKIIQAKTTREAMPQDIVQKLFVERVSGRITQKQLAKKIGISTPLLSQWENGWRIPNLTRLMDWCGALGYSLELTGGDLETKLNTSYHKGFYEGLNK